MGIRTLVVRAMAGTGLLLASTQPAHASLIFATGNNSQPNQENILFSSAQTGTTLSGVTNTTNTPVLFTGDGEILEAEAAGQARITAVDGFFDYLKFEVTGKAFDSLVLNIDANNAQGGSVTFYGLDQFNVLFTSQAFTLAANGSNFFTITTDAAQVMTSLWFQATTEIAFVDAAQFRVVPTTVPAPEPASILLLASGLAGLAVARRRKPHGR